MKLRCRYTTSHKFSLLRLQDNNYNMKSYLLIGAVGFKVAKENEIKLVRDSIAQDKFYQGWSSWNFILMPGDRAGESLYLPTLRKTLA